MEKTCIINDYEKSVMSSFGYANKWKSHLNIAEKLGYTLRTLYGFSIDTINKSINLSEGQKEAFINAYTPNDLKDKNVLIDAWKKLRKRGYTTNFKYLKENY